MKRLKAPDGTDEVNVGETAYPIDLDGTVVVEDDVAAAILASPGAGFTEVVPDEAVPAGFAKLQGPHGAAAGDSCSVGGVSYTLDANGCVYVPLAYAAELYAHGYSEVATVTEIPE
jgi:hypothetical protein